MALYAERAAIVCPYREDIVSPVLRAWRKGWVIPVFIGSARRIEKLLEESDVTESVEILDAEDEKTAAMHTATLARNNDVSMVVKGDIHTSLYLRALLSKDTRLRRGKTRVSHVFRLSGGTLDRNGRALLVSDAVLNIAPDLDAGFDVVANAVLCAHALGIERPNVALLSAIEIPDPVLPSSVWAEALAKRTNTLHANVFGPVALDLALSKRASKIKNYTLPGETDILIVPNIETGNAIFKLMVYALNVVAAGIIVGLRIPVVLTSRADSPESRLSSIAFARTVAQYQKQRAL